MEGREIQRKLLRLNWKGRDILRDVLEMGETDCDAVEWTDFVQDNVQWQRVLFTKVWELTERFRFLKTLPSTFTSNVVRNVFRRRRVCVWNQIRQERQRIYKRDTKSLSRNHCCREKTISITYSECVSVALVIQHAMQIRGIILLSVACPAVPCLSTLFHKWHHIRDKVIEHKTCFHFLYKICLIYFSF